MSDETPPPADSEPTRDPLAGLIGSLRQDAPPMPSEFRKQLRDAVVSAVDTSTARRATPENSPMRLPLRLLAVSAALLLSAAFWIFGLARESEARAGALQEALAAVRDARTLQFELDSPAGTETVWMTEDGLVRWEETPERYRIQTPGGLWHVVDADAGSGLSRVAHAATTLPSPLDLLGVPEAEDAATLNVQPSGRANFEGEPVLRFKGVGRDHATVFYVDPIQRRLRGVRVFADAAERNLIHEARLLAMNEPVDPELFAVKDSLQDDGRLAKVVDAQGLVTLRPLASTRWTPIGASIPLKQGDWLRTDGRGAHAARLAMRSPVSLTLGPGTLVEFLSERQVRLLRGELLVERAADLETNFSVFGFDESSQSFAKAGRTVLSAPDRRELLVRKDDPAWLASYEGRSDQNPLGSLVVNVDGKERSLSIGEHHVRVQIHDQIARTTIEETFRNETDQRLEGVFHFPLPQEASISGFGMWINGELVEADVVEKQRAREIYETILREKRDPGLLEWTGGSIFKARVFPILPHSEKRVKIVYTQVLPLRDGQFRYSYPLASEMLRTTPLRELSLDVLVSSKLPIESVSSPTHEVRTQLARRSAEVSYSAEQVAPQSDFELVCALNQSASEVVAVPHRRGDDGYFLLQFMPPGAKSQWTRPLLPRTEPLEVTLLCDTSASMNEANREAQADFVAAVLSTLGEDDRFRLAACDAEFVWMQRKPVVANEANREATLDRLSERVSLGWTDLDLAFESIAKTLKPAKRARHVIYVGDGRVTTVSSDPQAFASRLQRMIGDENRPGGDVGFHAVATGSRIEPTVLKAIATHGGGSFRKLPADGRVADAAGELLSELVRPGLRNVSVEFTGVRTAAVYPEALPNLAAGTQQIVTGRFDPASITPAAKVIVTGQFRGESIRLEAPFVVNPSEAGNSFIPRLWARGHLDYLLAQGATPDIQEQVIALSERFHIITPYTSLLVLESDADRERFGVKKRYQMRDGQRFFADAKTNAKSELRQQQMRLAEDWRIGLGEAAAQRLRGGLNIDTLPSARRADVYAGSRIVKERLLGIDASGAWYAADVDGEHAEFTNGNGVFLGDRLAVDARHHWGMGMPVSSSGLDRSVMFDGVSFSGTATDGTPALVDSEYFRWDADGDTTANSLGAVDSLIQDKPIAGRQLLGEVQLSSITATEVRGESLFGYAVTDVFAAGGELSKRQAFGRNGRLEGLSRLSLAQQQSAEFFESYTGYGLNRGRRQVTAQILGYVPTLPAPIFFPEEPPEPAKWNAEVRKVVETLDQRSALQKLSGGVRLVRTIRSIDPDWDRTTNVTTSLELFSQQQWLTRPAKVGTARTVHWCDEETRGVWSATYGLGRERESVDHDLSSFRPTHDGHAFSLLADTYRDFTAEVASRTDAQTTLRLTSQRNPKQIFLITIDHRRGVLLRVEDRVDGRVQSVRQLTDFVDVGGIWWPRDVSILNADGEVISRTTSKVTGMTADGFASDWEQELNGADDLLGREESLILTPWEHTLAESRDAVERGNAPWQDHLHLVLEAVALQNWNDALKRFADFKAATGDKAGTIWIEVPLLSAASRNATLIERVTERTQALVDSPRIDEFGLVEILRGVAYSPMSWDEYRDFMQSAKAIYTRQPGAVGGTYRYNEHWVEVLLNTGETDAALELLARLAEERPWDFSKQRRRLDLLFRHRRYADAQRLITALLKRTPELSNYELERVYEQRIEIYDAEGQYEPVGKTLLEWAERVPSDTDPHSQYLAWLILDDRYDDAKQLARQWLEDGRKNGELDPVVNAKLRAGLRFALGQYQHQAWWKYDRDWVRILTESVRHHAQHPEQFRYAEQILQANDLEQTTLRRDVQAAVQQALFDHAATADFRILSRMLDQLRNLETPLQEDLERLRKIFRERWSAELDAGQRQELAELLRTVAWAMPDREEFIAELRWQLERATDEERVTARMRLFDALINYADPVPFDELFTLLPLLGESDVELSNKPLPKRPRQQLACFEQSTTALQRVAAVRDALLKLRRAELEQQLEDDEEFQELSPAAQATERTQRTRKHVYAPLIARLRDASEAWQSTADDAPERSPKAIVLTQLAKGTELECLRLQLLHDVETKQALRALWALLPESPTDLIPEDDGNDDRMPPADLLPLANEEWERSRKLVALRLLAANAVQSSATEQQQTRLSEWVQAGVSGDDDTATFWRSLLIDLLLSADRITELEEYLQRWKTADTPDNRWRRVLAVLTAERGDLPTAISYLERVRDDEPLQPIELTRLADWYLVVGDEAKSREARVSVWERMSAQQIINVLNRSQSAYQNRSDGIGDSVDEPILFALEALSRKQSRAYYFVYFTTQFHRQTKDFRLLASIPRAFLHQTGDGTFDLAARVDDYLTVIEDEATADEILKTLASVRKESDLSDESQLGLDLLTALVEARAATVIDAPGPHAEAARAALQRAFARAIAADNQMRMARFLGGLTNANVSALAEMKLRLLKQLHDASDVTTVDGVETAHLYAVALSARDSEGAIAVLSATLDAWLTAHPGRWPSQLRNVASTWRGLLQSLKRHTAVETRILAWQDDVTADDETTFLTSELWQLRLHALSNRGQTSLGEGAELYNALRDLALEEVRQAIDPRRDDAINQLCGLFRIANDLKIGTPLADLQQFASETLPPLLKHQKHSYQRIVRRVADALEVVASKRAVFVFLLDRLEAWPVRYAVEDEFGWDPFAWRLAEAWRTAKAHGRVADHEHRFRAIVFAKLDRYLSDGETDEPYVIHQSYNFFWEEQRDAFLAHTLKQLPAVDERSHQLVRTFAEYLWHGLTARTEAIRVLLDERSQGSQSARNRDLLVEYLFQAKRHAEAIPILLTEIEAHPDILKLRLSLLTAYSKTGQDGQARDVLQDIEKRFGQKRWSLNDLRAIVLTLVDTTLDEEAYQFADKLVEETRERQGEIRGRDERRSLDHLQLSKAAAKVDRTRAAVDNAMFAWLATIDDDRRDDAVDQVRHAIRLSKRLDEYVATLSEEFEQTGQASPLVRKELGRYFLLQQNYTPAAEQLELARELSPSDEEIYELLKRVYRAEKKTSQVIDTLLAQRAIFPRSIAAYRELADAFGDQAPTNRHRAWTSIVEVAPEEAAHHRAYAELLEGREEWSDAIEHWKRVAELRKLEPDGLLGLAKAEIAAGRLDDARDTLSKLEQTEWDERFDETLQRELPPLRKAVSSSDQ